MDYSLIVEQLKEGIQDLRIRNSGLAFKNAELEIYCDRLAQGLPEGMLPKDIENIRRQTAIWLNTYASLKRK